MRGGRFHQLLIPATGSGTNVARRTAIEHDNKSRPLCHCQGALRPLQHGGECARHVVVKKGYVVVDCNQMCTGPLGTHGMPSKAARGTAWPALTNLGNTFCIYDCSGLVYDAAGSAPRTAAGTAASKATSTASGRTTWQPYSKSR